MLNTIVQGVYFDIITVESNSIYQTFLNLHKRVSEYVDLIAMFITDNIRNIEIEFVLSISWTFNYRAPPQSQK